LGRRHVAKHCLSDVNRVSGFHHHVDDWEHLFAAVDGLA
jgi:hypothetical protein